MNQQHNESRCNWNIVESGVKTIKPKPNLHEKKSHGFTIVDFNYINL